MSNSVRPQRRQPTRLPRPWDSPGKNTGVGCHFLLRCMKVKSESEVAQLCPTLSDPLDCSLPGSSVYGIFQARVLEWGATAFSIHGFRYHFYAENSPFLGETPFWFLFPYIQLLSQYFSHPTLNTYLPLKPPREGSPHPSWGTGPNPGSSFTPLSLTFLSVQ